MSEPMNPLLLARMAEALELHPNAVESDVLDAVQRFHLDYERLSEKSQSVIAEFKETVFEIIALKLKVDLVSAAVADVRSSEALLLPAVTEV